MSELALIGTLIVFVASNIICFWLGGKIALKEPLIERTEPQEILVPEEYTGIGENGEILEVEQ